MWNKGAVVIIKRGDEAIGNAIEDGAIKKMIPSSEVEDIRRENFFLKRQNIRNNREKIIDANYNYRRKKYRFRIPKIFIDIYAIGVYGLSEFINRYIFIKKE